MAKTGRLVIYDYADWLTRTIAEKRSADWKIGATALSALRTALDQTVANKMKFKRVVFDTHGNSGLIAFGKDLLWSDTLKDFAGRGYEQLFPHYSKMYFSGCNVSDGEDGWLFLEEVNKIFFGIAGGVSMAYTSVGFALGLGGVAPAKHLWGELRLVIREPGKDSRRVAGGDVVRDMLAGKSGDAAAIYAVTEL